MSAGVAITTVLSILVIMDIVGNSLVCAIIRKHRDMRTPINFLILNLAVADILLATFVIPKIIVSLNLSHPDGLTGAVLCKLLTGGIFAWVAAVCSILTLAAIAIERYYTVMYPHGNKWKLTKRKIKVIITASWVFSLIFFIPMFLSMKVNNGICVDTWSEDWMPKALNVVVDCMVFGPLLLMVVLYSRVVYSLWFKRNNSQHVTTRQKGVTRVRKRVTLMVVIVSVIFGICWGTIQVLFTLFHFTSYKMGPILVAISNTMVLFNSAVNPFVYALFNQIFREKIKGMISMVGPTEEPQNIELANTITQSNIHVQVTE